MRTLAKTTTVLAVVLPLALSGCANMTNQQQRSLSGGAIGAAGGAAIAAMTGGSAGLGALIGGGSGALLGALLPGNERPHGDSSHH
jgi:osmotically inducible lipoprotein OsmB